MDLAQHITNKLNNPAYGYNSVEKLYVSKVLTKLNIKTLEEFELYYGHDWDNKIRADYTDLLFWNPRKWSN